MDRPLIVGIGEIVWDMLPSGRRLGGAPVNFTYFAARRGARAYAVSAVGRDALGDETLAAAASAGLDTSYIRRSDLLTSRVLVTLSGEGIPQYEIVESVAWDALEADDGALALMASADAVCWGSLAQRSVQSRRAVLALVDAAPETCLRVFDINIRQHYYSLETIEDSLRRADVLKLNEDELPVVASLLDMDGTDAAAVISSLMARYALGHVIYTCGAAFSEVYGSGGLLSHIDTPVVKVADTVGAGDSFTATFVTALLQGAPVGEAHALAVEVSAEVCTHHGAF